MKRSILFIYMQVVPSANTAQGKKILSETLIIIQGSMMLGNKTQNMPEPAILLDILTDTRLGPPMATLGMTSTQMNIENMRGYHHVLHVTQGAIK